MLRILTTLVLVVAVAGCAARGTMLKDAPALPPLGHDQARLFIYRDVVRGGIQVDMVRPDMLVNGASIGEMQAGAVIALTVPPGDYHVELAPPPGGPAWSGYNPVGEGQRFTIAAGEEVHLKMAVVRFKMGGNDFAVRVAPVDVARREMQDRILQERSLSAAK